MSDRHVQRMTGGVPLVVLTGMLAVRLFAQEPNGAAPAAAAPAAPETAKPAASVTPAPAPAAPVTTQVGPYTLESRGPWTASDRVSARPPGLWQLYMHGVVDYFAKPVPWEDMLVESQPVDTWLDKAAPIQGNPFRASPMPALRLTAGQELVAGKPLVPPDRLNECAGKTIRVFAWLSGKDTGVGGYLWNAAPRLDVLLTDSGGAVVAAFPGLMATRGTFPWHCYYRDIPIPTAVTPAGAEPATTLPDGLTRVRGLYVRATNPASGTAWFSTLSWEVVDTTNTYALADLQDPQTGSAAPNPRFDELPVHLASPRVTHRGTAPAYEWGFLVGVDRGAVNVPPVVTTTGLGAYLATTARQDPHHLLQGVTRLPEWYHCGMVFKCLPALSPEWLAFLGQRMVAAQNAETGFWGYAQAPSSMAVTAAVVERMFGGSGFRRADRPAAPQPWLTCGDVALPNADRIAKTVLALQSTIDERSRAKGAWSLLATHYASPDQLAMDAGCSLAATADAMFLLRRCGEALPGALQMRGERAVREACAHVWAACVLPSGLWKQNSTDTGPTVGGAMARLVEASPLLEFRVDPQLRVPVVPDEVVAGKDSFTVAWREPSEDAVGVRIYVAPAGTAPDALADQWLAGVIQKSDGDVRTMDPLVGVLTMRRAGQARWGASGFADGGYTQWKLRQLPDPLPSTLHGDPVTIPLPKDPGAVFYACAVNAYGDVSRPLPLNVKLSAKADEAAPAEAVEPATEAAPPAAAPEAEAKPAAPATAPAAEAPPAAAPAADW